MVNFEKILYDNINHNMVLDKKGVLNAMVECYNLGLGHSTISYEQLKNVFEEVITKYLPEEEIQKLKKMAGLVKSSI